MKLYNACFNSKLKLKSCMLKMKVWRRHCSCRTASKLPVANLKSPSASCGWLQQQKIAISTGSQNRFAALTMYWSAGYIRQLASADWSAQVSLLTVTCVYDSMSVCLPVSMVIDSPRNIQSNRREICWLAHNGKRTGWQTSAWRHLYTIVTWNITRNVSGALWWLDCNRWKFSRRLLVSLAIPADVLPACHSWYGIRTKPLVSKMPR